jgi:hypothetical protein
MDTDPYLHCIDVPNTTVKKNIASTLLSHLSIFFRGNISVGKESHEEGGYSFLSTATCQDQETTSQNNNFAPTHRFQPGDGILNLLAE